MFWRKSILDKTKTSNNILNTSTGILCSAEKFDETIFLCMITMKVFWLLIYFLSENIQEGREVTKLSSLLSKVSDSLPSLTLCVLIIK